MSLFSHIPPVPHDPIYGLQLAIRQDLRPNKSNLSIGILVNPDGTLKKFEAVIRAQQALFGNETKEYLPIDGLSEFRQLIPTLLLSKHTNSYTAQTIGGTGALFIAANFLHTHLSKHILIPDPTWINHKKLFESCGLTVSTYPHKTTDDGHLNIHPIIEAIKMAPPHSTILFQASCHNPTGIDPTLEQWQQLSLQTLEKKMLPFFDLAYQGLGKGLADDVLSIELFLRDKHECIIANSMAKNFGIYSDRVGSLTIVSNCSIDSIASQIKKIIRSTYSSPPAHGARIVAKILTEPHLRAIWEDELQQMRQIIDQKRDCLHDALAHCHLHSAAAAVKNSVGLFSQLPIDHAKIHLLREKGIYLADDGRVNIAAITTHNAEQIAAMASTR